MVSVQYAPRLVVVLFFLMGYTVAFSEAGVDTMPNTTPVTPPHSAPYRILYVATTLSEGDWPGFIEAKDTMLQSVPGADVWTLGFSMQPEAGVVGAWETQAGSDPSGRRELKKVSNVGAFDPDLLREFLWRRYLPGRTHLVIGTHGLGGFFEFGRATEYPGQTDVQYPIERFVSLLTGMEFLSVVLDACLMAELTTAIALSKVTKHMVACEGWMWEEDTSLETSVVNSVSARLLSFQGNIPSALSNVAEHFSQVSRRGDASVISTDHASALLDSILSSPRHRGTIAQCESGLPELLCPLSFYDGVDVEDSMRLLDVRAMLEGDPVRNSLMRRVVSDHYGPSAGRDQTSYTRDLGGMSLNFVSALNGTSASSPDGDTTIV